MNDCLQKNVELLIKRYPQIYHRVSEIDLQESFKKFRCSEQDGVLNLYEGEQLIDSNSDHFFSSLENSAHSVKFMQGFGLGSLLQRVAAENFRDLFVIEPSIERFLYSLSLTNLESVITHPQIHWMPGLSADEFFAEILQVFRSPPRSLYMDDFRFVKHPVISKVYSGYFERIEDEWTAARNQIRRNYGGLKDSLIGLKNLVENLNFINTSCGIKELKASFKDVPAIVVSAGPSLKKSMPQLKGLVGRALFIANDATCSVLVKNGIEPQFVCSLERTSTTKKFFEDIPGRIKSCLVTYPIVPKEVIESFPGQRLCAFRDYGYFRIMSLDREQGILPSSSSVAHMCVRLASYLACDPIVLVGQDLCFDLESFQSHVEGIAFEEWTKARSLESLKEGLRNRGEGELIWLKGNLEEKVPSCSTYFSFLKEFSWEVTQTQSSIVNATEGGAQIPGIPWMSLNEISSIWEERPVLLEKPVYRSNHDTSIQIEKYAKVIRSFSQRISSLEEQAEAFTGERVDPQTLEQVCQLLQIAKMELVENAMFSAFVLEMNARSYLDLENEWNVRQAKSSRDTLNYLKAWFHNMKDAAQQVLQVLSES